MWIQSKLVTRNVTVHGRRTSIRLEKENWSALEEICQRERISIHELCSQIDSNRTNSSRTSTVRAFITAYCRKTQLSPDPKSHPSDQAGHLLQELLPVRTS
ncbi:ribbon-helix-helix domain-containing protein [Magnetospira thiophila]